MTGRCATCKWARMPEWRYDTVLTDYRICDMQREADSKFDTSEYLYVQPDFGCVQWKAREVSPP